MHHFYHVRSYLYRIVLFFYNIRYLRHGDLLRSVKLCCIMLKIVSLLNLTVWQFTRIGLWCELKSNPIKRYAKRYWNMQWAILRINERLAKTKALFYENLINLFSVSFLEGPLSQPSLKYRIADNFLFNLKFIVSYLW